MTRSTNKVSVTEAVSGSSSAAAAEEEEEEEEALVAKALPGPEDPTCSTASTSTGGGRAVHSSTLKY
jgi:hypothetical protein